MNNRTAYTEYLQVLEKKIIENPDIVFSVVVFDINQLKVVNDDFGHDAGDKLIIEIAGDINEAFDGTRIYRTGGDEFVAILDEPDPSERIAAVKATIARKNMESPIFHDPSIEIGLSVGAATYDPSIDRTYSEVFNRADNAMYADKRAFYQTHEDRRKKKG
jgi:diguanylate cyclase (GGDEF)-like protein